MKQVKFVLITIVCLFDIYAKLPENPGLSVLDGGTGALGSSPMISAIFNIDDTKLILEMGGVSYYDTPIIGDEQIYSYFCGALLKIKQNRISLSVTSLSALDLYSETNICGSYALSFARILHLGIGADYLILQSEGDYIFGGNSQLSAGIGNKILLGIFSYTMRNITDDEYNPMIQEIRFSLRSKENRFGSQGVSLKSDDYLRRITTELSYGFSIGDNISIGVSFVPKPFVIKFGFVLGIKTTKTSAAFSLHNVLGLSKYLSVQYLLKD